MVSHRRRQHSPHRCSDRADRCEFISRRIDRIYDIAVQRIVGCPGTAGRRGYRAIYVTAQRCNAVAHAVTHALAQTDVRANGKARAGSGCDVR